MCNLRTHRLILAHVTVVASGLARENCRRGSMDGSNAVVDSLQESTGVH